MMLLLDRLITLLLLLPKHPVRTSFSLLRRWRFLLLISISRFVIRVVLEEETETQRTETWQSMLMREALLLQDSAMVWLKGTLRHTRRA
ncbi:hypothetical protein ANAPC1_01010 [Anaplasma phagocytophilum]|uniref:Uncharacterized protein n=1 Tax=Anaplasma phagocytophilum TaxID=948 RepID=A0AA45UTL7_ANAPH|nr:hypothetical protein ANAPC1_01010 [Anaplasma phagocytophilum]